MFRAPPMLLPHESTVAHAHEQKIRNEEPKNLLIRTKSTIHSSKLDGNEVLVHTRPTTPTTITHSHDEDLRDDDEESDKKSERSDEEAK
jgi:5'-nucleotidase